jgi:amidase
MNTEGVLSRTVRDTAALLDAISDRAPGGPWPAPPLPGKLTAEVGHDPGPLTVGLCVKAFNDADVDDECRRAAVDAAELLAGLGHHVAEDAPPELFEPELMAASRALLAANAAAELDVWSARLGRALGDDDVEPLTWRMVRDGRAVSGAQVLALLDRQHEIVRRAARWWDGRDLLLTPSTAEPAPPLGAYKAGYTPGRAGAFTRVFNATGQPALSLPLGWPDDGLPRGVQLVAAHAREDLLIRVGSQLEQATPWTNRRPRIR